MYQAWPHPTNDVTAGVFPEFAAGYISDLCVCVFALLSVCLHRNTYIDITARKKTTKMNKLGIDRPVTYTPM